MHTYSIKRPADRTIVTGLLIAAVLTGGAAIGLSRIDFGNSSPRNEPAPTAEIRLPIQLPTLDDGPVPGMPAGTHARLTAQQPPALDDGPVPGMPAGTHAQLTVEQRRQAILDAWPEPQSTLDEFRNSLGR